MCPFAFEARQGGGDERKYLMPHRENLRTLIPLEGQSGRPTRQSVMTGVNGRLEKILAVDRVRSLYDTLPACSDPFQFLEMYLERLQIAHRLDEKEGRSIPLFEGTSRSWSIYFLKTSWN